MQKNIFFWLNSTPGEHVACICVPYPISVTGILLHQIDNYDNLYTFL